MTWKAVEKSKVDLPGSWAQAIAVIYVIKFIMRRARTWPISHQLFIINYNDDCLNFPAILSNEHPVRLR